jgi:hypothetical protein
MKKVVVVEKKTVKTMRKGEENKRLNKEQKNKNTNKKEKNCNVILMSLFLHC